MWIWKNRDEIDVIEWDKYLQHSSSQQIELSSWYLDIVAQHWGAFYHKASGARIPVVYHTKWIFINQVYRPSFIQQMNIISQNTLEVTHKLNLIQLITQKFPCGQFNSGLTITDSKIRKNYVLSLFSYNQQGVQLFSAHHRKEIVIASSKNLNIQLSNQIEVFIDHYQTFSLSKLGHSGIEKHLLEQLISSSLNKENGILVMVFDEFNQLLAGAFFLSYKRRLVYLMSYTNPEGKKKNAMYGLLKYVFDHYKDTHDVFDFEGSDIPGIQFFFEGFGATLQIYSEWIWRDHFMCKLYHCFRIG
jgi:energy-converting hydrogenase A subunit M